MNDYTVTVDLEYSNLTIESGKIDNINIVEIDRYGNAQINITSQYPTLSLLELPTGYPINDTIGDLPYVRVSGLATYIQSLIPQQSAISINGGTP